MARWQSYYDATHPHQDMDNRRVTDRERKEDRDRKLANQVRAWKSKGSKGKRPTGKGK